MSKRKPGIYAHWFEVCGTDSSGGLIYFHIYENQAKNYVQAVRFWKSRWGRTHTAIWLRNAPPFSDKLAYAC